MRCGDEVTAGSVIAGNGVWHSRAACNPTFCTVVPYPTELKRNGKQRIDQPAVEDDGLFGECSRPARLVDNDPIMIAASREQRRLPGMHDARDDEAGLRMHAARVMGAEK